VTISRKVGPHIIGGTSVPIGQPTFVKLVDVSVEYYREIRAIVGPDVLIEVRWAEPNDYQPLDDPERRAQEWWNKRKGWILAVPASDNVVYAGYNEIGDEKAEAFCLFEVERMRCLHEWDRSAAVFSLGVGCPGDIGLWGVYDPVIRAMRPRDVIDLHEYWVDNADVDNVWHVCWFTIPEIAVHLVGKRIVVSEIGRDVVESKGRPGWQHTTNAEGFLADLEKAGRKYHDQPNVVGCAVFQLGSADVRWRPFNCYGIWPTVVYDYGEAIVPAPASSADTLALVPPIDRADIVRITRGFDPAIPHYGIDYSCLVGRPVYAACDGMARVLTDTAANGGFGRYVRIETPNYRVYTAHLSEWLVDDGAQVRAGLRIGLSGNTGNSTGPHLHFEVRRNAGSSHLHGAIDPEPLIVWAVDEPPVAEPYLPTNDPFTQAASTEKERYTKIRWWIEERRRQYEAGAIAYADQIDAALIEQMYTWEGSLT